MTSAPEAHKTAGVLEWRCFHCDDVFTSEREARLHFGRDECSVPACQIKGSEGGLVEALRRAEDDAAEAWAAVRSETVDAVTAYHAQAARHREQIRALEQVGYDRGLADAKVHPEALGLILSTPCVPAVAELSGGLALGVAGAAEGNLLTAAKKALAFYDSLDREHDPGEAAVLDALDTAVRAALTASPAGDDPKALDAEARSSSTEAVEQEVYRLRGWLDNKASEAELKAVNARAFGIPTVADQFQAEGRMLRGFLHALAPSLPGKEEGR